MLRVAVVLQHDLGARATVVSDSLKSTATIAPQPHRRRRRRRVVSYWPPESSAVVVVPPSPVAGIIVVTTGRHTHHEEGGEQRGEERRDIARCMVVDTDRRDRWFTRCPLGADRPPSRRGRRPCRAGRRTVAARRAAGGASPVGVDTADQSRRRSSAPTRLGCLGRPDLARHQTTHRRPRPGSPSAPHGDPHGRRSVVAVSRKPITVLVGIDTAKIPPAMAKATKAKAPLASNQNSGAAGGGAGRAPRRVWRRRW